MAVCEPLVAGSLTLPRFADDGISRLFEMGGTIPQAPGSGPARGTALNFQNGGYLGPNDKCEWGCRRNACARLSNRQRSRHFARATAGGLPQSINPHEPRQVDVTGRASEE